MGKNNTPQQHSGWESKTGATDVSVHNFVFQLKTKLGSRKMLKQMAKGWGEDSEKRNAQSIAIVVLLWSKCCLQRVDAEAGVVGT